VCSRLIKLIKSAGGEDITFMELLTYHINRGHACDLNDDIYKIIDDVELIISFLNKDCKELIRCIYHINEHGKYSVKSALLQGFIKKHFWWYGEHLFEDGNDSLVKKTNDMINKLKDAFNVHMERVVPSLYDLCSNQLGYEI
jgi:hypothetical protein